MEWLRMETWSPYVVGMGIGVLTWFTFLLSDKILSCSTSFSRLSGMLETLFAGKKAAEMEYYRKTPPKVDWQVMLVIGIVIGAFLSAFLSGSFRFEMVPPAWFSQFGENSYFRFGAALVGGVFLGVGSRWSNGCTSGHGISGTLQMALSGWISVIVFFIAGIGTAFLLYI